MISENDLLHVRTALLITLSILLVAVLWKRLRLHVLHRDMPAPLHAEVLRIELAYHPARLLVRLKIPSDQVVCTRLLDQAHAPLHRWADEKLPTGDHDLLRPLPALTDGVYFLEMATSTQRTVRQFRLQQA